MGVNICSVIVTYNRKTLLLECLGAILSQTHRIDHILIINNASTDGTPDALRENGYIDNPHIQLVTLPQNVGGAGGFHQGIKCAYEAGFEWIWLMDDDTIPHPDTLAQLLEIRDEFPAGSRPNLLSSKAIWTDGSLHPMNIPQVKITDREYLLLATEYATLSIRYATFVSLLIHRSMVEKYGLPIADYFIWADDVEYTARILRYEFGVTVPSSIVTHKTIQKYTRRTEAGSRYYYHIRNNIWIILHSEAWSGKEKAKQWYYLLIEVPAYLINYKFKWQNLCFVVSGIRDGFLKAPDF